MKTKIIVLMVFLVCMTGMTGCQRENKELKKDARNIAGVMCKSIEAMKNLRAADPADSLKISELRQEYEKVESEMRSLYDEFHKKYGKKTTSRDFGDSFRKYLNEAMLECKSLSKEDRENFERGLK
jgi:hypothetical protein